MVAPHHGLNAATLDGALYLHGGASTQRFGSEATNLEVMDVATGLRKVLHSEPGSIQAPNWTPDNKLLYNSAAGVMYSYDIATNGIADLNTGKCRQNNNDHVLSFDGNLLALSNFDGEPRRSFYRQCYIRLMPASGGVPKTIRYLYGCQGSMNTPGWSPDSKRVAFVSNSKLQAI